ncbi:MAG: S8 family serine peptidase [Gemmatimonadales bacterium]|nr:S8 family serine peptidase [Gemmatimonadales bacterium]NIN12328.1 S8 family serine peptidase [Gemmatimonadales bacterium]NIN48866.1 S8 family serine peptidase [Gemmatimonadales bacterium]NIP06330.1 S8 family serine peptidase [Gemmatimonadales bacterium]NIR00702.1 S8 family serine peptidase [Gemmatimonadales bacterium]
MRRIGLLLTAVLVSVATAQAQRPTVSRALEQILDRDTVVTIWFFGAPQYSLDAVAAAVEDLNGRIRRRSRWLHAVSATIASSGVAAARNRVEFRRLQPVARFVGRPERAEETPWLLGPPAGLTAQDSLYGPSAMPFRQLELFPLASRGFRGGGVTIAMLDTGFETEHPAFDSASVIAQRDFVFDDSIVRNEAGDTVTASQHGTETWSLLAANLPTQIIGVAPEADYILAKTEDIRSETRVEEDHWVAAIEWADSIGVDVVSSSVGYLDFDNNFSYQPGDMNGDIAVTTVAADSAAARGIVVVTAAGNNGVSSGAPNYRSLITPADGDSVIAVGAEDSLGVLRPFSSRGPTADGRIKPDLTAPGQGVFVVNPLAPSGFSRVLGTSFSTPLIAGAATLLREIHPTLTPLEILEALRRTGSNRAEPDSNQGWGRPSGSAAAFFPRGIVVANPVDTQLTSVTPTFSWSTPEMPAFAAPVSYRLVVARDTTFAEVLLDTTVAQTSVTFRTPQPPDTRFVFTITATGVDSVTLVTPASDEMVVPPWAALTTLDDPVGVISRDLRPTFEWTSPAVATPPGPFTYDVAIIRADDGEIDLEELGLTRRRFTPSRDLERNTPYRWRVISRLGPDSAVIESRGTFVIVDDSAPSVTLLFQNFPNPFPSRDSGRRATCIWFDLAVAGRVRLDILDIRGHVVRILVPTAEFSGLLQPGRYGRPAVGAPGQCDPRLEWDGTASDGSTVAQGVYLLRLQTPAGTLFKRIVFMGPEF